MRRHYLRYLAKIYRHLIPDNASVLEIGCGGGDLLAAIIDLDKSGGSRGLSGVGIDFAPAMLDLAKSRYGDRADLKFALGDAHYLDTVAEELNFTAPFDIIILSDLINDIWDLREIFAALRRVSSNSTRVIINFHSHLYEKLFLAFTRLGVVTPHLRQNWFTPDDVANLAHLADYEVIRAFSGYLCPFAIPLIEPLLNRYFDKLPPFSIFNLTHFMVLRPLSQTPPAPAPTVSVIVPARNEAGNIENAIRRIPAMGGGTEIIFVEGNSSDNTPEILAAMKTKYADRNLQILTQNGKGKGDAVRRGFAAARGDILMILDADLTVVPESLPQFYDAIASGKAEFVNGVRLVYPRERDAMRLANLIANKFFGLAFSYLLGQRLKDTLCGTKVISRANYERLLANRHYFGNFDPFGDFDLLFGAAKLQLAIRDLPVRYRDRRYGQTQIRRWRDGWYLLRMVLFAARRIKFI